MSPELWSISAIARHLGLNRRTVRSYLSDEVTPGVRRAAGADGFEPFVEYARLRLVAGPHLWASALHDELVELGYRGSYPSLTRALRVRGLRPHCEGCAASKGRDHAVIAYPPGEETQRDWLELPDPPHAWGWGKTAHLLVGSLAHSSRWRAAPASAEDQPHLIEALDAVARWLGGLTLRWRFDRMATVCHPGSGRLTATFGPVAAHYAVGLDICPPRRGNRKGVVEKVNHSAAQRWWRTLADELSPVGAQASLDRFCVRVGDARARHLDGQRTRVGALAAAEGLRPAPTGPYPAVLSVARQVSDQGLVAFRGNSYSTGPGRGGATVTVTHRLGTATLDVISTRGVVLARHHPRRRFRGRGHPSRRARDRNGNQRASRVHRPGPVSRQATPTTLPGGPSRSHSPARRGCARGHRAGRHRLRSLRRRGSGPSDTGHRNHTHDHDHNHDDDRDDDRGVVVTGPVSRPGGLRLLAHPHHTRRLLPQPFLPGQRPQPRRASHRRHPPRPHRQSLASHSLHGMRHHSSTREWTLSVGTDHGRTPRAGGAADRIS
ncbi:MAG: Mu transposase domain-containing protein [Pseudonocardiaceae bacterium]